MSQTGEPTERKLTRQYTFNMVLVGAAGGAGCITVLIIFVALFAGLWLDNLFDTRPVITILLMVGSVPITLVAMLWLVRFSTSHLKPTEPPKAESIQEEA